MCKIRYYIDLYIHWKCIEIHTQMDSLREHALAPWNFDKLPGNNPQNWPVGLDSLNERLKTLPELNFFYEPFEINQNFKIKSKQFVENTVTKVKSEKDSSTQTEDVNNLVFKYVEDQFAKLQSKNTMKVYEMHSGKWWVASPKHWNFSAATKAVERVWGVKPDLTREGGR